MDRITRRKAAEILGVSRQTISNYIEQGLIGSYKDHSIVYVNSEDIKKYAEKYKILAVNEKMIDDKLKELKERKNAINIELAEMRNAATAKGKLSANAIGMLFVAIDAISYLDIAPHISCRESQILKGIIKGKTFEDLADEYDLTPTRIRQIVEKTCDKFSRNEITIIEHISTNKHLVSEVARLNRKIKDMQMDFDSYRREKGDKPTSDIAIPPKILSENIGNFGFPVRIMNIFRYSEVYTVGDLLRKLDVNSLKNLRNLGKKSIYIILDFMEQNHLTFKNRGESDEYFYMRLNKLMNKKHEEND